MVTKLSQLNQMNIDACRQGALKRKKSNDTVCQRLKQTIKKTTNVMRNWKKK